METPEHLEALEKILNNLFPRDVNLKKYADVAFQLLEAAEGDKKALKNIASYIQEQHEEIVYLLERESKFKREVGSWLNWAINWTIQKS